MKDYYRVLGINPASDLSEVKAAFRSLARRSHPDVDKSAGAKERFVAILEAYEVLGDENSRAAYDRQRNLTQRRNDILESKEEAYREWFMRYQAQARENARKASDTTFNDFLNSPVYKTAMVLSRVYNYVFMFIGVFMIAGPMILWHFQDIPEEMKRPFWTLLFPAALGVGFTFGIWYFLFKHKQHE